MRVFHILMGILLVGLVSCVEPETTTGAEIEEQEPAFENIELNFFTIDKGVISSRPKGEFILRSEFEYQSHFGRSSNGFNFGDEMMLAVYKGSVPLSGHNFTVTKILERENDVLVTLSFESCVECNTSDSAPFHVVGLDRTNKNFVFEEVIIN